MLQRKIAELFYAGYLISWTKDSSHLFIKVINCIILPRKQPIKDWNVSNLHFYYDKKKQKYYQT